MDLNPLKTPFVKRLEPSTCGSFGVHDKWQMQKTSGKDPLVRNQEKGVFRRGFLQNGTPLLAVAL